MPNFGRNVISGSGATTKPSSSRNRKRRWKTIVMIINSCIIGIFLAYARSKLLYRHLIIIAKQILKFAKALKP